MSRRRVLLYASIAVVVAAGVGFFFAKQRPRTENISQYVAGEETPPPAADAAKPAQSPGAPMATEVGKAAQSLSSTDLHQFTVLREIIQTRNDNDPRFDSELVNLSPELKQAMAHYYHEIPTEQRNGRGTIAFLIAREIKTKDDLAFLNEVLMEKPCLSLTDCSKPVTSESEEEKHMSSANELTASYPQLTTLQQSVARYHQLQNDPQADRSLLTGIRTMLENATHSPNPRVASEAQKALDSIR